MIAGVIWSVAFVVAWVACVCLIPDCINWSQGIKKNFLVSGRPMVICMWWMAVKYTWLSEEIACHLLGMMHSNSEVLQIQEMRLAPYIGNKIQKADWYIFLVDVAIPCSQKCWTVGSRALMSSPFEGPVATVGGISGRMKGNISMWVMCAKLSYLVSREKIRQCVVWPRKECNSCL